MKLSSGELAPNGRYTWTISARPAGGGAAYTGTGSITVTGGANIHDYNGDGRGDLLGVTSAGRLDTRYGTTANTTVLGVSGSGWPSADRFIAFGDLDQDRYNDLLVLDSAGKLWLYPGKAGGAFTPSAPHILAGTGFQIYNSLFSPGDLTADGIPDLLLRDSAGKLWLRAGTAAGGFKARTLVGSGYQQYTLLTGSRLVSAGGILARDKSGVLWRQETDGKGHLKARVRIGSGWNQYNSLTQVGSLNGVGADVFLARDGAGVLWRYASNGGGGFTSRVRVGAGWQVYKTLF
jgi:hypothetical protein